MPINQNSLINALRDMKLLYESVCIESAKRTQEMIRSKEFIGHLHDFTKEELRRCGIKDSYIYEDKRIVGHSKPKEQDILVQTPQDGKRNHSTGPPLVINIRSQLSSIGKNYDTLFERVMAEATNLHGRFPALVSGYIYLLPTMGYNTKASGEQGRPCRTEKYDLEKYLFSFHTIAKREKPGDEIWKHEEVCLLVVDFERDPPKILDTTEDFLEGGRISQEFSEIIKIEDLSIKNFFDELLKKLRKRYYFVRFTNRISTRQRKFFAF